MFTGIVQDLAPVGRIIDEATLKRLEIQLDGLTDNLQLGASVAVNGTCLTVTRVNQGIACFDVIRETLDTTNLGDLSEGDLVNIERSFAVGDEVGGHIVSGHVTATAELTELQIDGHDRVLTFQLAPEWIKYVFHKGFIALDGASLTVSALMRDQGQFQVSLIPETIARTTLGQLQVGDRVNIEVDAQTVVTVDTVERLWLEKSLQEQPESND